jgi:hypothetical protein
MTTTTPAPATEAHLTFLDQLRASGETNMFGSRPYLQQEFPKLSAQEASAILAYWMKTFHERHKED